MKQMKIRASALALAPWLSVVVAAGCGDEATGAGEFTGDVGSGLDSLGTEAGDEAGSGGTDSASAGESGDSAASQSGSGSSATGDGADESGETGAPAVCDYAAGCATPGAPDPRWGLASHTPVGCGSGDFFLSSTVYLDEAPYGVGNFNVDATKLVPIAGDVTGDGVTDIVLQGRKLSGTQILAGLGVGEFATPIALQKTGFPNGGWGVDIGDLNGDGTLDVAVGDHNFGGHAWVSGGGVWTESSSLASAGTSGAGVADLDGDGALDVVLGADQFGAGYAFFWGDGRGGFQEQQPAGVDALGQGGDKNIGNFAFADYDDDGDVDIFAFANTPRFVAVVFRNEGGRAFTRAASLQGPRRGGGGVVVGGVQQGGIGDINCDGRIDVAVGGAIHLASGTSWVEGGIVDQAEVSKLADLSGDGHLDLVTHNCTHDSEHRIDCAEGGLNLYLGDGSGAFTRAEVGLPERGEAPAAPPAHVMTETWGIAIGHFDGNDNLDIVRGYLAFDENGFGTDTDRKNYLEVWVR